MSGLESPTTSEVYSVGELTAKIKGTLDEEYSDVRVSGEISGAKHSPRGHWYFTLKDKRAEIACVCFRGRAQYLRTKPADGLAVVARGNVSVYERQGKYQLYVASLEPQGVGALQREFERLKARLGAEGLFDPERKRELPFMPRRIGLVTSSAGAAIADMLTVLKRRFPGLSVRLFPVSVQGAGAGEEIAEGLRFFSEQPWAEIVIVGRGGGSLEDLWAFNEEVVARAIAASEIPVVSAVGHETDFTIADFVADRRAPTPSAAAELIVPEAREILQSYRDFELRSAKAMSLRLERLKTRVLTTNLDRAARIVESTVGGSVQALDIAAEHLRDRIRGRLERRRTAFDRAERGLAQLDLRVRLARQGQRVGEAWQRIVPAIRRALDRRSSRLQALSRSLSGLSPVAILERGYAIARTADGTAVREHNQVAVGDALDVKLHRGSLDVRVEKTMPGPAVHPESGSDSV